MMVQFFSKFTSPKNPRLEPAMEGVLVSLFFLQGNFFGAQNDVTFEGRWILREVEPDSSSMIY